MSYITGGEVGNLLSSVTSPVAGALSVGGNLTVVGTTDMQGGQVSEAFTGQTFTATGGATPTFTTDTGMTNTGFVAVKGKTSGQIKLTCADACAQTLTLSAAAQTSGASTLTIADQAGVGQTILTKVTSSGNIDQSANTGIFKTPTGLNTIGGKTTFKAVVTPVAAAGAGGGVAGAAQLGTANHVYVSSDGATKGVKLATGVAGDWVFIFNTSGTACDLFAASGGTINGGGANVGCAIPASTGVFCACSAADTWDVVNLGARAGAAA